MIMYSEMTDIERLIIGVIIFLIGYFVHLIFRKNKTDVNDEYPLRLSKFSGTDHLLSPENNLEGDIEKKYKEAMLSYDSENFEKAVILLTDCISDTNFSEFYYYRGISYFALKKYQSAINDWETAIKLFPDYEYELSADIREAKKLLEK